MLMKIHESYKYIVALCDTGLLGKKFEEGIKQIEINNFFKGDEKNKEEVVKILRELNMEDATFNIVGKESVACGIESGVVSKEGVMKIDSVPIALGLM